MDCYRHPGEEAEIVCFECGRKFCPICVRETGASHQCPECYRAEVEKLSERLGAKKKRRKREEEISTAFVGAVFEEKTQPDRNELPAAGIFEAEEIKTVQPLPEEPKLPRKRLKKPSESKSGAEIMFLKEIPAKVEVESEPGIPTFLSEEKCEEPGIEEIPKTEGYITGGDVEDFWGEEEVVKPKKERTSRLAKILSFQQPDQYEGYLTEKPRYMRAIFLAFLVCALCASAYGGLAWWRHKEFGIFGWLIGLAVGIAVVYASGKHFNWKLGMISAIFAMVSLSAGRILVYMLEVWFPDIIKLPIGTVENFKHALRQFVQQLPSTWLAFLIISSLVAFLLSFRPWPVRVYLSSAASK